MKKTLYLFIISIIIIFTGCSQIPEKPSLDEPVAARSIDAKTSKPLEATDVFSEKDPIIYFTVKASNLPKDTRLKAVWKYLGDNTEIPAEVTAQGTGYIVFTLKKSGELFPKGQYEIIITSMANNTPLEVKGKFEVVEDTKPTHLLNPITSKSIDNPETLNPLDITAVFSQSDPVIYFIIQTKDLPENTKISCMWFYVDTEDSISHEIITSGSRNVAFHLKPNEGGKLPTGKYRVTASVKIDEKSEYVSKEFEITK